MMMLSTTSDKKFCGSRLYHFSHILSSSDDPLHLQKRKQLKTAHHRANFLHQTCNVGNDLFSRFINNVTLKRTRPICKGKFISAEKNKVCVVGTALSMLSLIVPCLIQNSSQVVFRCAVIGLSSNISIPFVLAICHSSMSFQSNKVEEFVTGVYSLRYRSFIRQSRRQIIGLCHARNGSFPRGRPHCMSVLINKPTDKLNLLIQFFVKTEEKKRNAIV